MIDDIIKIPNRTSNNYNNYWIIYEESYRKDVNFIYGDIREKDKLLPLFDQNDAVIWLAALVGDGACSINPDLITFLGFIFQNNLLIRIDIFNEF